MRGDDVRRVGVLGGGVQARPDGAITVCGLTSAAVQDVVVVRHVLARA